MMNKTCSLQASIVDFNNQANHSAALIGFNDDLLTEILLRLPISSILRFKSVCKHWRSLLSHRRFTVLYDKGSVSTGFFVRDLYIAYDVENQRAPPFRSLDFYRGRRGIKIIQSCNGLLLCRGKKNTRKYYICNPTTMQISVIPSIIGRPDVHKTVRFMGLAFHQADCVQYKVVCLRNVGDQFQIQIYSSDTGKWRISHESAFSRYYDYKTLINGVYWNGAIHWVPSFPDLLYFKLDIEELKKLPLPEGETKPLYMGESRGHLHLVGSHYHSRLLRLNMYELLSNYSGWFIKYVVYLDELPLAYPEMIRSIQFPDYLCKFEVFDVVRGEEGEDTFMVVKVREKIIRYNIMNNTFREIFNLPNLPCYRTIENVDVHRYIKSLSSLKSS